jgi:hypothetical protein
MEELPSDTIVEGWCFLINYETGGGEADEIGHYRALLWKEEHKAWTIDQALGIHVNVEVRGNPIPLSWS